MNLFASAGIYVLVDLPTPDASIDRDDPSWTVDLYDSYTKTIDSMAGYSNLLGFFAGNEISNNVTNSDSAAAVKAAVRDMKAYIKTKNYRSIGVGYATYDDAEIFDDVSAYYNCGVSEDSVDFYGLNIYTWCGDSTYTASGYSDLTAKFENYSVPVFFSEYGCNAILPRNFTEVSAIYGPQMTGTFSGGIAYSYFDDSNDFGRRNLVFLLPIHVLTHHRCGQHIWEHSKQTRGLHRFIHPTRIRNTFFDCREPIYHIEHSDSSLSIYR